MYKRGKKGQAALEFLMTYGWAILVVLIVIGALASFGVFDMNSLFPDRCTTGVQVECKDHRIAPGQAQIYLQNNVGAQINVTNISIERYNNDVLVEGCYDLQITGELNNGAGELFTINDQIGGADGSCVFEGTGGKDKFKLFVTYKTIGTGLERTIEGEILTKVE